MTSYNKCCDCNCEGNNLNPLRAVIKAGSVHLRCRQCTEAEGEPKFDYDALMTHCAHCKMPYTTGHAATEGVVAMKAGQAAWYCSRLCGSGDGATFPASQETARAAPISGIHANGPDRESLEWFRRVMS